VTNVTGNACYVALHRHNASLIKNGFPPHRIGTLRAYCCAVNVLGSDTGQNKRRGSVEGRSANHFELAFTEFEFLLDFGQLYDDRDEAIIHTRIIVTPRSTKTFLHMLQDLVEKYENTIGPIPERKL